MTRNELASWLIETRRYVRRDPSYVTALLNGVQFGEFDPSSRFEWNIRRGVEYIRVDPEVLENYLYNVAFELRLNGDKS